MYGQNERLVCLMPQVHGMHPADERKDTRRNWNLSRNGCMQTVTIWNLEVDISTVKIGSLSMQRF